MSNDTYVMQSRRPMPIDGMRRPAVPSPGFPPINPGATQRRRAYHAPRPEPAKRNLWQILQLPLLLVAGALGGFFAETLGVGLSLLAVYGIVAFVTRIPSRTTFTLALLLLAAICVMLLAKPSAALIQNFSTYAFVLLMVGVVSLGREARLPKRIRRKYRR